LPFQPQSPLQTFLVSQWFSSHVVRSKCSWLTESFRPKENISRHKSTKLTNWVRKLT
jgi:hypothetical protein